MTTLTNLPDFSGPRVAYRDVAVRFTRREYGGWIVVNAANGRRLGWVVDIAGEWRAYSGEMPFRQNEEDWRAYVPTWLSGADPSAPAHCRHWSVESTRTDAVRGLLGHLLSHRAPALGIAPEG